MRDASTFPARLHAGQAHGEAPVRSWLERGGWTVREATRGQQRDGIDLVACGPAGGPVTVECKWQGEARDAFFLELSKGLAGGGWLYTTAADWLALVDHAGRFLVLCRPAALRARVGDWIEAYGQVLGSAGGRTRATGVWVPWWCLAAHGRIYELAGEAPKRL